MSKGGMSMFTDPIFFLHPSLKVSFVKAQYSTGKCSTVHYGVSKDILWKVFSIFFLCENHEYLNLLLPLVDPNKARGCFSNTVVIQLVIDTFQNLSIRPKLSLIRCHQVICTRSSNNSHQKELTVRLG